MSGQEEVVIFEVGDSVACSGERLALQGFSPDEGNNIAVVVEVMPAESVYDYRVEFAHGIDFYVKASELAPMTFTQ